MHDMHVDAGQLHAGKAPVMTTNLSERALAICKQGRQGQHIWGHTHILQTGSACRHTHTYTMISVAARDTVR